jgi:hypothetical protein
MELIDDTIKSTIINEYVESLNHTFLNFQKKNKYCCMALTKSDLQCRYTAYSNRLGYKKILCKLHSKKKYSPEYIIVYIDGYNDEDGGEKNIIAYPYKNEEQYYKDINIYKKELKDIYIENLIKIKQIVSCKVCNDIFKHNELIKCSNMTCDNKHLVCSSCLSGYIDSQISNNIGSYECMFNKLDKCNGNYSHTSIVEAIEPSDSNKLSKWNELVNITDVFKLANVCDNYIICPLCRKWGCILETPVDFIDPINIKCMNCKLEWCNLCKRDGHSNTSCYKLVFKETETMEKRIQIIDTMIQDIISKALTHKCSTCGCAYIKEEGCNLMVCSHCGGMTCYLCNAKIYYKEGRGKYWHFAGHEFSDPGTTCLTWNNTADDGKEKQGNTEYNNNKIIKELLLFISNNFQNIRKIIYSRILLLCEKDKYLLSITKMIEFN